MGSLLRVRDPATGEVKDVLCLRGETGPQGPAGETGPQGEQGPQGATGNNGHTPQKGVDYFTPADIAAVADAVYAKIADGNGVAY